MITAVQIGETITLTIQDMAYTGYGVGRHDGCVVFVPFVIDGETVKATVTQIKPSFARAELEEIIVPSPHRVIPRCPWFGRCGGCQYQHVAYEHQLSTQVRQLQQALQRIGGAVEPASVEHFEPSPRAYEYRNKLVLHGKETCGLIARDNKTILPIDRCPIAAPAVNGNLSRLRQNPPREKNSGRLAIRCNRAQRVWTYDARSAIETTIDDIVLEERFRVPLAGFFQVNYEVMDALARWIQKRTEDGTGGTLIDAYCGAGIFALLVADRFSRVYGIEKDQRAVRAASFNARQRNAAHCDFISGSVEHKLENLLQQAERKETTLILDPPRGGCTRAVLKTIAEYSPKRVIYLSCNAPVFARDFARLRAAGYFLRHLDAFDMFPQTTHFETAAVFEHCGEPI